MTIEIAALTLPRRRARLRGAKVAGCAALALAVGLGGTGWWEAKVRLGDTRARLEATTADLAARRADIRLTHRREALTRESIAQVEGDTRRTVDERHVFDAGTAGAKRQMAAVAADRAEVDAAQALVVASSADALACFDGVSSAVHASRRRDDRTSAGALRGAARACGRTLAAASGAAFPYDFPDPFVLATGSGYYGYSTNSGAGDIQVIRSSDLARWELVGNALPRLPAWAAPGSTWAPSVLARGGGYVVYYTVREAASGRQCISRAVGATPAGPFRDDSAGPLMCQRELGGSIDPSPFVDADGRAYLLWKAEGGGGWPQTIWSQELSADGRALVGFPHALVSADRAFERGVVEAPSLVREGGAYRLVYAAASWNSRGYTTAVATCAGPTGPCTKPGRGRVLSSGPRLAGPGGVEVFRARDGALWAAFHAFSEPHVGYPASRYLYLARMRITPTGIAIDART